MTLRFMITGSQMSAAGGGEKGGAGMVVEEAGKGHCLHRLLTLINKQAISSVRQSATADYGGQIAALAAGVQPHRCRLVQQGRLEAGKERHIRPGVGMAVIRSGCEEEPPANHRAPGRQLSGVKASVAT